MSTLHATCRVHHTQEFWNCNYTASELKVFSFGLACALVLHLSPILEAGLAIPILIGAGVVCFMHPATGFFFIGASAVLPTASADVYDAARELATTGRSLATPLESGTKFAFLSWAIALLLRYRRISLRGIGALQVLIPLLAWLFAINGASAVFNLDLFKSMAFSVMACQLANASNGQYLKCALGLSLGMLVATSGFWLSTLGLPVELSTWGGERGGFERLGSVAMDSALLWPPILIGLAILMGLIASFEYQGALIKPPKWLPRLTVGAFLLSLPPLFASMTNSGYIGLALMLGLFFLVLTRAGNRRVSQPVRRSLVRRVVVGALVLSLVMFATNAFRLSDRLMAYTNFYGELAEDTGLSGSRGFVWSAALETIRRYPLTGPHFFGRQEIMPESYADRVGYYLSHNVFLDYGRRAGIPAMLLYALFFFWPTLLLLKKSVRTPYLAFLFGHFGFLLLITSLSTPWYKPLWAFWMLTALVASRRHAAALP